MNSSDRKVTPGALAAAMAALADPLHGYGAVYSTPLPVYGIADIPAGPWTKYQAMVQVANVAEPTDTDVLQALAEVDHHQLVAEAVIERHTGGHTLH